MSARQPLLRIEQAGKRYGGAPGASPFRLGPLSVEILRGSWTVLTGRSGAGKTTLLHLLAGLDRPDEGAVWMFGEDVTGASDAALSDLRRVKMGIVYQHFHFIEHLPVWQNVTARLVPAGVPPGTRRRMAEETLGGLGLADRLDRLPRHLSAGEQQRVALARAMVHGPEALICDEPTSNLDAATGAIIVARLKALQEAGTTIVLSTHDPSLVALADHRHELEGGRITA